MGGRTHTHTLLVLPLLYFHCGSRHHVPPGDTAGRRDCFLSLHTFHSVLLHNETHSQDL